VQPFTTLNQFSCCCCQKHLLFSRRCWQWWLRAAACCSFSVRLTKIFHLLRYATLANVPTGRTPARAKVGSLSSTQMRFRPSVPGHPQLHTAPCTCTRCFRHLSPTLLQAYLNVTRFCSSVPTRDPVQTILHHTPRARPAIPPGCQRDVHVWVYLRLTPTELTRDNQSSGTLAR
jgi:hypothetical protein